MKQFKSNLILLLLLVSTTCILCAFSTFRNEGGKGHANVVTASTPITTTKGGTIWTRSLSNGSSTSYNSIPIVTENSIYIVNSNQLYELDLKGNIKRQLTLSSKMDSISNMLLNESQLYIPLSNGLIECVSISTMTSVWKSESFGGQSLSTLFYHEGYLYAGTTTMKNGTDTTGIFYCLNASDGNTKWTYQDKNNPGGYYWSGGIVYENAIYFIGDSGVLISHSLTTDEVFVTKKLTDDTIRSGITYDAKTDALYTVSTTGELFKIEVSKNGSIDKVTSTTIVPNASFISCTSTPTIYNGRLYVGCLADSYGQLSVLNAYTLSYIYSAKGEQYGEIKSSPLVSTGYANDSNHNQVYVYVTSNRLPGGIFMLEDNDQSTSGTLQTLYMPATAKQYCMASVSSGIDGTLYYSNDSGTLFAVQEVDASSDKVIKPSPQVTTSNKKTTVKKPKRPIKIKCKKKKKNYILTWKKKTKNSQTVVYVKYGSGKWKKNIVKKKSRLVIKKSKKKIRIRLRSRIKKNKAWYYSSYTKTLKLR